MRQILPTQSDSTIKGTERFINRSMYQVCSLKKNPCRMQYCIEGLNVLFRFYYLEPVKNMIIFIVGLHQPSISILIVMFHPRQKSSIVLIQLTSLVHLSFGETVGNAHTHNHPHTFTSIYLFLFLYRHTCVFYINVSLPIIPLNLSSRHMTKGT